MSKERYMQQAIADALAGSPLWPAGAQVIVARPGDLATAILEAVGKTGLCAVVGEPDNIEGMISEPTFAASSDWTVAIFTQEFSNQTGIDNLAAASLVRQILSNTNPGNHWATPFMECRIKFSGQQDGIVARDVTFTAAYQGTFQ